MVLDPAGRPVAGARVEFACAEAVRQALIGGDDGGFAVALPAGSACTARVMAAGFAPVTRKVEIDAATANLILRLEQVSAAAVNVIVMGDVTDVQLDSPDPSQKVMVREQLLDANPGRPGAPISIPGLPIETAAGGIKAPQYFVPGVAGDHGEPIAQYIAVGGYLVTNNLSANAHGNGYADPNIYVSGALGSVTTDGGAFNVLEGNHALNLAATYGPLAQMSRFLTLTGDYRDLDVTAGYAPRDATKKAWVAIEANYGNGLLKDMEHRRMMKLNAQRIVEAGRHEITLFGIGYWGVSHEGNLVPIGFGRQVGDTLDPRQKDQTHTVLVAADDRWRLDGSDELAFSGFFRTYNLALFSNFGEGLIRQSEFRTVEGAEVRETHSFKPWLQGMAGLDYHEDDIHNDDLDNYPLSDAKAYGSFVPVLGNNVTIRDLTPYAALHGELGKHVRIYGGLRPDTVELKNVDKMKSTDSFDKWSTFLAPKGTVAWTPGAGRARWLPSASFSVGQAFFTEDPRTAVNKSAAPQTASPFERSHSVQLVLEKQAAATDVRVTLGHTTTTETLGKIDPDNGSQQPLGPGKLNFLTASARHRFSGYGSLQAIFSKADARLLGDSYGDTPQITPEAPRTIFDALATLDKLPGGIHARAEYEYVGHKLLDKPNAWNGSTQMEAIAVGETRLAVVRTLLNGRLEVGANGMLARGYTGQTTETIAPLASGAPWQVGDGVPSCPAGSGPSGLANDFDCGATVSTLTGKPVAREWAVGIRMVSFVGGSVSWRFGSIDPALQ